MLHSVEPADIFVAEGHSLTCPHAGQEAGHPGSPQPHSSSQLNSPLTLASFAASQGFGANATPQASRR